ncbi:MAG: tetratricopeptide repeat protein, partial [Microcoleaceae cyanobacterium]
MATITATIPSVANASPCDSSSLVTEEFKFTSGELSVPVSLSSSSPVLPSCGVKFLAQANQTTNSGVDELLRQGRELVDARKYQKAIAVYQQAARLDPKNAQIYSGIAYLQALEENFQAAAQFYQQAVAIDPHNADFQYGLGYTMAKLENYQAAAEAYRRASLLDRSKTNAHLGLGASLFRQEKYNEAIVAYQVAIQSNPKNAEAYASMGLALLQVKRFPEALQA